MWNVYEYRPNDEKVAVMLLVAVVLLVGAFSFGYLLGLRNVSDNGGGTGIPGVQLEPIIVNQQHITDSIQQAADTSSAIAGTSHAITESANSIADGVSEAAGIIDGCQQLLGRIRNRAEENKVAN